MQDFGRTQLQQIPDSRKRPYEDHYQHQHRDYRDDHRAHINGGIEHRVTYYLGETEARKEACYAANDGGYEYVSNVSPYAWIFEHMASYGYVLRYPDDKTDITGYKGGYTAIRYVGLPHAKYIAENDLCLEEYLTMLRDTYVFGKNMLTYTTDADTYKIYYVPADPAGDTMVPVPNEGMWEISGNNIDGFIVTTYGG